MRLKVAVTTVVCLLLSGYALAGLLGIQAHSDPGEMDTTAYLDAACQIRETGGILKHIPNCLSGVYREATQHPGYLLLLSPFAERNVHFFVRAKVASFCVSLIFAAVFFWVVLRLFGAAEALVSLCFLVTAATFVNLSTMVACESLLAVFFLLFWFFAAKGFEKGKLWLAAGFFAGAAFLTKSIAILSLPVFFLSSVWLKRGKVFADKYFWGFFAVFFLVASPLLLRNVKVYGTPLYSDSSAVLWIDRWHDYYRADIKENPPTLSSYLKTHSPERVASIFFTGLFSRDPKMLSDGLKPVPFWEKEIDLAKLQGFYEKTLSWQGIWAALLFLCFLGGIWKARREPAAFLACTSLGLFAVFVGWYSKVFPGLPPTRLLYPVIFFVWIYAAAFLAGGVRILSGKKMAETWIAGAAGMLAVFYVFTLGTHFDWKKLNISKSYAFTNPFVAELFWVDRHVQAGDKLMAGTVFMSYLFYFQAHLKGEFVQWPQVDSMDELKDYVSKQSVKYGVLDLSTVVYDLVPYRPYFDVGPHIGLHSTAPMPAPFQEIFTDPNNPVLYRVYEFGASA